MKIVIDTSPLGSLHKTRGIGTYTRCLAEALKRVDQENEYIQTSRPNLVDADLVHYPFFDFFFLSLPLIKKKPTVVTIHDVIPLIFPKEYKPGLRGSVKYRIQRYALKSVKAIITDSDCSKRDIINQLDINENKVHRVYLAADTRYVKLDKMIYLPILKSLGLTQPYFLYVGDINFNKNATGLIQGFAKLETRHQLVLVSKAFKSKSIQAREIRKLILDLGLTDRVLILDNVPLEPNEVMGAVYSGADWYIQPSFYEGFGLPVLESFTCGTPAIISTGGSLPEITPPGSITFNPENLNSLANALNIALKTTDEKRQTMIVEANNYRKQFSWDKTARETIGVYQQALLHSRA